MDFFGGGPQLVGAGINRRLTERVQTTWTDVSVQPELEGEARGACAPPGVKPNEEEVRGAGRSGSRAASQHG